MLKNLGKKEKIELTITGIGVVFLIFLVFANVQKVQAKRRSMVKTGETVTSSLSAPISFETAEIEESAIKEGWGRDPFFLGNVSRDDIELDGMVLNGIVWDEDSQYAIVNGEVIKVGDKLGDKKIVEINKDSVVLEQDGNRHTLTLPSAF